MLRIIHPKDHYNYRSRINIFLGLLEFYQNMKLHHAEQDQCSFVLDEDKNGNICGGAVLYKKSICDLEKNIANTVSDFDLNSEFIWASTLVFCPLKQDKQLYFRAFYQNLLETFREIGHHDNIHFLCLTLNPHEYFKTKNSGGWSYIAEVNPQESLDGFFHGILSIGEQKPIFHVASSDILQKAA